MFEKWIAPFRREASGEMAKNHVRHISNWHRIQASPGYRQAADYVYQVLQRQGVQAEIVSNPASADVYFGNCRSFREWRCTEAELWLIGVTAERLAQFTAMEMSVIQRSTATPQGGVQAELVVVEHAEEEAGYEHIDVRGKIVLARGDQLRIFQLAVGHHGAAGIVLDNMTSFPPVRTREDLADAVQYTSFWWYDEAITGFGFAVSPRVGQRLRELCKTGPVTVRARVDAELVEGSMENIEALIPGTTDEEVLLVSHLCHPKPGANDNASGPSTLLETARILQKLIDTGVLAPPSRGIRFLMMPEMTGTHAYLYNHPERVGKTVAALNLDMVGADLTKSGGPLTIEKSSRSLPSYTAELVYGIFSEVAKDAFNFLRTFGYSLTPYVLTPFSGGSDHYILADPSVGIPCPMMITWPDKYYHTSMDTVDNIDAKLMEKVAITAATYLYWVANAKVDDLDGLAGRLAADFAREIQDENELGGDPRRLAFLYERKQLDLASLGRLVPTQEQQAVADWASRLQKWNFYVDQLYSQATDGKRMDIASEPPLQAIYQRKRSGPIELRGFLRHLSEQEREEWYQKQKQTAHAGTLEVLIQYWMDGKRTLEEVIDGVELESGLRQVDFTLDYVRLLDRLGLIERG